MQSNSSCNYCGGFFGDQEHCNNCGATLKGKGAEESMLWNSDGLAWFGLIIGLVTVVINRNIISFSFGLMGFFLSSVALIVAKVEVWRKKV